MMLAREATEKCLSCQNGQEYWQTLQTLQFQIKKFWVWLILHYSSKNQELLNYNF